MAAMVEWNPVVAQKWFRVGERAMSRSMSLQHDDSEDGLWAGEGLTLISLSIYIDTWQ